MRAGKSYRGQRIPEARHEVDWRMVIDLSSLDSRVAAGFSRADATRATRVESAAASRRRANAERADSRG
jgi:hypothetical protein